jgi:hypothetical protein
VEHFAFEFFYEFVVNFSAWGAIRLFHLVRSSRWPLTQGTVLRVECPTAPSRGCTIVAVIYEYPVGTEQYGGLFETHFWAYETATHFAKQLRRGRKIDVRVNPRKPDVSVPWHMENFFSHLKRRARETSMRP